MRRIADKLALWAGRLRRRKFCIGDQVAKVSGAQWRGYVVGFYSTELTPIGYAVESDFHANSVQIYPEAALKLTWRPQ